METDNEERGTIVVESDSGCYIEFTDADNDGDADFMVERDEQGSVRAAARFDRTTGEWVAVEWPATGG